MIVLLLSQLISIPTWAQTPSPKIAAPRLEKPAAPTLTLSGAIRKGLEFSVEIQSAQSEVRQREADFRSSEARLFPTLDLKAAAGNQQSSSAYRFGFSGTSGETEVYRAYLALSQPLYAGGGATSGISAAKLAKDAAAQRLFDAKQKYAFGLIEAYFKAAQNQLLLALARDNRSILKSYYEVTSRYASIGRSKNIDRLTAEASYNLSEAEVLNAESELERSLQDLQRATGGEISLDTNLENEIPLQPVETGTLDQLYQKAIENNPEIRALELDVEEQKYINRTKLAEHYPKLSLDGTYGYDSPDRPNWLKETSEYYSVFLNLTIPLFSGFRSLGENQSYKEEVFQRERTLMAKRTDLQRSLAKAMVTIEREFRRLKLTQTSAAGARKAMDVAVRDYRNGLLSSLDVLNIQRTRFDADRQYANAQFSYHAQVLRLRKDLGIDLEKAYASLSK